MKQPITPAGSEILPDDDDFIVSKTDPKGRIIDYFNRFYGVSDRGTPLRCR